MQIRCAQNHIASPKIISMTQCIKYQTHPCYKSRYITQTTCFVEEEELSPIHQFFSTFKMNKTVSKNQIDPLFIRGIALKKK